MLADCYKIASLKKYVEMSQHNDILKNMMKLNIFTFTSLFF